MEEGKEMRREWRRNHVGVGLDADVERLRGQSAIEVASVIRIRQLFRKKSFTVEKTRLKWTT